MSNIMEIPFHQYQRYKMTELMINSIREDEKSFRLLEVGANEHKNLEKFLKNDSIVYLDLFIPEKYSNSSNYIKGDATKMDFEDNSFDFVIALDVLEHINPDKRYDFFMELKRVSKYGFIVSAPFSGVGVEASEKRISDYFNTLYDEKIIWHLEHIKNGFPDLLTYTKFIKDKLKLNMAIINHGSIYMWEKFIQMEFMAGNNPKLFNYWNDINKYYNEMIFERDFSDECIRSFIVASKDLSYINKINNKIIELKKDLDISYFNKVNDFEKSINNLAIILEAKKSIPINSDYYIQLFIDIGDGYDEKNSMKNKLKLENENIFMESTFDLSDFNNIKNIRIDPFNEQCYIKVREIIITDFIGKNYIVNDFITNADIQEGELYLFLNNDPQIIFTNTVSNIKKIKLVIDIISYNFNLNHGICKVLKDNKETVIQSQNKLKNEINEYQEQKIQFKLDTIKKEKELQAIYSLNEKIYDEISVIKSSKSWKLTKPFRLICKYVKNR
ncbi:class I SAM-dependent methyltransferase [Clostridium estertheticum]|uniref:class I SAM-dependent methyltransferase n=1 Tax=Clostridium estertheticum TaxID=238834 RepID=UPI001C7E0B9F|nr:class I SAM-dependent methyltransferase [Clostridium estertheticum]MBX4258428.1 class I SAM-dependent methyltransferase [Clostridium estertheticum]WLC69617.1 class I SAM-dependent methyltransferase [Clostridium estertheticum]